MLCELDTNSFILSETLLRGSQVPLDLHGSRWKGGHSLRDFKVNYVYRSNINAKKIVDVPGSCLVMQMIFQCNGDLSNRPIEQRRRWVENLFRKITITGYDHGNPRECLRRWNSVVSAMDSVCKQVENAQNTYNETHHDEEM